MEYIHVFLAQLTGQERESKGAPPTERACEFLQEHGFKVKNMVGGMLALPFLNAWVRSVLIKKFQFIVFNKS